MFRLQNPVYLHILSEILILCSLVVWMSSYRKRTTSQIEKLLLRIEEQDEKIQKLEQQFLQQQQLSSFLTMPIPTASMARPKPKPPVPTSKPVIHTPAPVVVPAPAPVPTPVVVPAPTPVVAITPTPPAPAVDEDLDALIQAELAELQSTTAPAAVDEPIEEISTEDLKKKSP
jgi:hypothetical protein